MSTTKKIIENKAEEQFISLQKDIQSKNIQLSCSFTFIKFSVIKKVQDSQINTIKNKLKILIFIFNQSAKNNTLIEKHF